MNDSPRGSWSESGKEVVVWSIVNFPVFYVRDWITEFPACCPRCKRDWKDINKDSYIWSAATSDGPKAICNDCRTYLVINCSNLL